MAKKREHEDRFNRYISVVLAVVIIAAVGIYAYTHLVEKEPATSANDQSHVELEETLLTISVGSETFNYSLNQLIELDSITGSGKYINKVGKITGPNSYTGVPMNELLGTIESLPENYTLRAIASNGYSVNYSMDEVHGLVSVYNETGDEIGTENMTMIIAYKENGELLNQTTSGPLRVAFVDGEAFITSSGMWLRSLVKIEII
ncbi:MAG: hypothetical protein ACOC80_10715 [Petrotogales bacterium]